MCAHNTFQNMRSIYCISKSWWKL